MPIESADDLAVFFDPEEFGEAIIYDGVGGLSAIWNRPTEDVAIGSSAVVAGANLFEFPATMFPAPAGGGVVQLVRTGERFVLAGEPRLNRDGKILTCEAEPTG